MARGLASLISMFGAGAQGYMQGQRMVEDRDRRARLDARDEEIYQRDKDKYDKAQALDADISGAMADRQLETVNPPEMTNADLSMLPAQTTQYKVGDQTFDDEGKAKAALQGMNSKAAKYQRAAQAAAVHGAAGVDKAAQYEAFAKQALNEGTDQILGNIQSAAPALDAVKKAGGMVAGTVGEQAADVFNKTGGRWKVGADTGVQYYVDKDAAGREFVNFRVMGKDGKAVVDDGVHSGLMLQDYKTRLEAQNADRTAYQTGQQIAQGDKRITEEVRKNKVDEALGAERNRIAAAGVNIEKAKFDASTPAGKIAEIEKATGPISADQKMTLLGVSRFTQADQVQVQSLLKRQEQMEQAKAKAMAEGMWNPNSEGAKAMATENAIIGAKLGNVLAKYGNGQGKGAAAADPLGIMGDQPKAGAAAPARPAARGTGPAPSTATVVGAPIDVRGDPALAELNAGIARLAGKSDPASVKQLMDLGTAKNARIEQLRQNYGSMAQLVTE